MADAVQTTGMELVLDSFERNSRVNEIVLGAVGDQAFEVHDEAGGWSVGEHLAHMADFRRDWLSFISPEHAKPLPVVAEYTEEGVRFLSRDIGEIREALQAGDRAAREAVTSRAAEGRPFEGAYVTHPAHFLQHTIVHDSHHRGQVMSLLRRSGRSREQMAELEDATWRVWNEAG